MTTDHRLPTLPLEELHGDKRSLKPFAKRIGREDSSLTFDEYIRFLEEHDAGRDANRIRKWFEPLAAFYATFPTWQDGRRALLDRSAVMTAEQREMRRQLMEVTLR